MPIEGFHVYTLPDGIEVTSPGESIPIQLTEDGFPWSDLYVHCGSVVEKIGGMEYVVDPNGDERLAKYGSLPLQTRKIAPPSYSPKPWSELVFVEQPNEAEKKKDQACIIED